jgi:hypothetical protein
LLAQVLLGLDTECKLDSSWQPYTILSFLYQIYPILGNSYDNEAGKGVAIESPNTIFVVLIKRYGGSE